MAYLCGFCNFMKSYVKRICLLITRRSLVQVQPPQPHYFPVNKPFTGIFSFFINKKSWCVPQSIPQPRFYTKPSKIYGSIPQRKITVLSLQLLCCRMVPRCTSLLLSLPVKRYTPQNLHGPCPRRHIASGKKLTVSIDLDQTLTDGKFYLFKDGGTDLNTAMECTVYVSNSGTSKVF